MHVTHIDVIDDIDVIDVIDVSSIVVAFPVLCYFMFRVEAFQR